MPSQLYTFKIHIQNLPQDGIQTAPPATKSTIKQVRLSLHYIHTLRVYYAHAAANLNSEYLKYAKVARVHYFCTIALRTSRAVLTQV